MNKICADIIIPRCHKNALLALFNSLFMNYNVYIKAKYHSMLFRKFKEEETMAKPVQLDANGYRKFGIRDKLAYAAGDFGCNMSFALKGTVSVFWTQYMQVSLEAMALLMIIVQVWDAINDPLIGSLVDADKKTYKRNKFLQYIFVGSIGLIAGASVMFLPFPQAPMVMKYIMFVIGYIAWDAFYTIANVPYGSVMSLITADPTERASLSVFRSVGSMVGNLVPPIILPFLIYDANDNLKGNVVFFAALIMGGIGFLSFQYMIKNTVVRVEQNVSCNEDEGFNFNIFKSFGSFFRNRAAVGGAGTGSRRRNPDRTGIRNHGQGLYSLSCRTCPHPAAERRADAAVQGNYIYGSQRGGSETRKRKYRRRHTNGRNA